MNERQLVRAMGGLGPDEPGPDPRPKPRACRECMAFLSPTSPWDLCQFHLKSLELRQRAQAEGQAG